MSKRTQLRWCATCKGHRPPDHEHPASLFDVVDEQLEELDLLKGPGQARVTDPDTSHAAARLVTARAGSARVVLLEAHGRSPDGLTDEEAAIAADLALSSEYATRCSELTRLGALVETTERRRSSASRLDRVVRRITPLGLSILEQRKEA